ncbi:uncharacterized protein LOC125869691 [Solanum stenotomum]|uniref:uncharacterized protein LOC125869691 n=1 Tax=Solanum stenotomum TaxID=172797 RepID=UPI0020D0B7A5|nr:uncharacterized protein LOC125869691 [Solanum stenotomum]
MVLELKGDIWNVTGLNCGRKRSLIRKTRKEWNVDAVCLQETKLSEDITEVVRDIWGNKWVDYVHLEASGTRGGIVIMWDKRDWEGKLSSVGMYSVSCSLVGKTQDFKWHLTCIYAPNHRQEREETWGEIGATRGLFSGPCILCGDFNTTRHPLEKKNCRRINNAMSDLSEFIEDMELVNLDLKGGKYTWKKGDRHDRATRLDRILISDEMDDSFKYLKHYIL